MFNPTYISELLLGRLSEEGYRHFLTAIASLVYRFNWPKSLIGSPNEEHTTYWANDEVEELAHQFFEWALTKGKFTHLHKVPASYTSYYFSRLIVSFVADKIKEVQHQQGISYDKVRSSVIDILNQKFIKQNFNGKEYWYYKAFEEKDIMQSQEVEYLSQFLPKNAISADAKQYKSYIDTAINDIYNGIDSPLNEEWIFRLVFEMFNQTSFANQVQSTVTVVPDLVENQTNHGKAIQKLIGNLSVNDAKMFHAYLFQTPNETSLSSIAASFQLNKQTAHYRIDQFRKKIFQSYMPENEEDGIEFLKKLANALDKHSN